jgi:hypothetical protein
MKRRLNSVYLGVVPHEQHRTRRVFRRLLLMTSAIAFSAMLSFVEARVTRFAVTRVESPTLDGAKFGKRGPYEKIVGKFFGELDPSNLRNQIIVDLDHAPRNARGMVEYSADFYILRPVSIDDRNGTVLYEFGNRGNKRLLVDYNSATSGGNDPKAAADAGNGFLMREGYTLVWSGLLGDVAPANNGLTILLPVARNADASTIEGTTWEECNFFDEVTVTCPLFYPVPRLDQAEATLLVRERRRDPPIVVPPSQWTFAGSNAIRLLPSGTPFRAGFIYQFIHKATNPPVMGIGFAATRDWISFLRYQNRDDDGNANPIAGIERVLSYGLSQTGRVSREFVYLGFNEDEFVPGRRILDGMDIHLAATRPFINFRFARPTQVADLQHEGLFFPTPAFPFAYEDQTDPLTGKHDGILHRCAATETCPKVFHTTSSLEYWVFKNSPVLTDPLGTTDVPFPPNVRGYLFTGGQHLPNAAIVPAGVCEQPPNVFDYRPLLRSLLVALQDWVRDDKQPPESRVPQIANATLVKPENVAWPPITGVTFAGPVVNRHPIYDYGPDFERGLITTILPVDTGKEYQILVPQVDVDGNDIAGIRLPGISVPLATHSGWAVRAHFGAVGELCNQDGSLISFPITRAQRLATGDPRLSLEERYGDHQTYVRAVKFAAVDLVSQRFLLQEDADLIAISAFFSDVLR